MNFELFHTDDIRVEYCDGTRRDIQRVLDDCREERRPYLVIKNDELRIKNDSPADTENHSKFKIQNSKLTSILVPVSMLEEEVYNAEICT